MCLSAAKRANVLNGSKTIDKICSYIHNLNCDVCESVCLYEYFEDNENMHVKFTQVVADYLHINKAMSLIEYAKQSSNGKFLHYGGIHGYTNEHSSSDMSIVTGYCGMTCWLVVSYVYTFWSKLSFPDCIQEYSLYFSYLLCLCLTK